MARLIICVDPMSAPEVHNLGGQTAFDLIRQRFPGGFGDRSGVMVRGGQRVDVSGWDFAPEPDEVVSLMVLPGDPVVSPILLNLVIGLALSALTSLLAPKPETPTSVSAPKPSPIYNVSVPTNNVRLGEAVPVLYGELTTSPDHAMQPYTWFDDNVEYLGVLLCVSQGRVQINDVLIGGTSAAAMPAGVAEWRAFGPNNHLQAHGHIESKTGVVEDMVTSIDVTNAELIAPNGTESQNWPVEFTATQIKVYTSSPDEYGLKVGNDITVTGTPNDATYTITARSESTVDGVDVVTCTIGAGLTTTTLSLGTAFGDSVEPKSGKQQITGSDPSLPTAVNTLSMGDLIQVNPGGASNTFIAEVTNVSWMYFPDSEHAEKEYIWTITAEVISGSGVTSSTSCAVQVIAGPALIESSSERWVGWIDATPPGAKATDLYLDLQWPAGLYAADGTGALTDATVTIDAEWQEIDDSGDLVSGGVTGSETITMTTSTVASGDPKNTPKRLTHKITPTAPGRYRVRAQRTSAASDQAADQSKTVWSALKARKELSSTPVYGNVTLVSVKMKASGGVSQQASGRVRVVAQRRVPKILSPIDAEKTQLSASPASAAYDILAGSDYGAGVPASQIDVTGFTDAKTRWDTAGVEFNYVFDQQAPIWEAVRIALQPALAQPLVAGGVIGIAQEGPKTVRSQVFSPMNIVAGTLRVRYAFAAGAGPDGVRVIYRDASTLEEKSATFPAGAVRPEEQKIFGITDPAQALDLAIVRWEQRNGAQAVVEFETEQEGRILQRGDRIGLSWPLFGWGTAGRVVAVNGLELTLDRDMVPDAGKAYAVLRDEGGSVTDPVSVSMVDARRMVLSAAPSITIKTIADQQEPTFVSLGQSSDFVQDYTVTGVSSSGKHTMRVEAVAYLESSYAGTVYDVET